MKESALRPSRRQIFVLTPEEKRVVTFVMLMILLGVGAKEYRQRHPPTPIPPVLQKNPGLRKMIEAAGVKPDASIFAATPRPKRSRKPRQRTLSATPTTSPAPAEEDADSAPAKANQPLP